MKLSRILTCLIVLSALASCNYKVEDAAYQWDADFVENRRQYSPDGTKLILSYSYDVGNSGVRGNRHAVLKTSDLHKELTKFNLPEDYINPAWIDNKTISAKVDVLQAYRTGVYTGIREVEIEGVRIRAELYDYIENDYHFELEYREISPDGTKELVVYRYLKDSSNLGPLHISVIPAGGELPKYGNYYIGEPHADYLLAGTWHYNNLLSFTTKTEREADVDRYFVYNKPKVPYQITVGAVENMNQTRWRNPANENKLKFGVELP